MLNYIKAELWKVLHRRGVYVLLALLLLCTALFFMLYSYGGFSSLAKGISVTMVVGMLAAPLLVQLVDGGTADTLKNELSFGLRRGTVYWGKLCAALLLGLAFCLVLVGGSLAGGWLFLPRGRPEEALEGAGSGGILTGRGPAYLVRHVCPVPYVGPGGAQSGGLDRRVLPDVFHGTAGAGVSGDSVVRRVRGVCAVHPVHCGCAALFAADARAAGWLAHRPVPALVLGHRPGMDGGQHGAGAVSVWPERRSLGRRFPRADRVYTAGPALCGLAFWCGPSGAPCGRPRTGSGRWRILGSTARVRLAVPNSAAEELLDEVNRLLELRQADRAAYQARERALRQQIANVSHDLRTPLTSILGYLQLLEDPGLTEGERREYLAVIAGGPGRSRA